MTNYIPIKGLMKIVGADSREYIPVEKKGMLYVDPVPISVGNGDSRIGFFPFQYNPEQLTVSGGAVYEEHGAKGVRQFLEYVNSNLDDFPLEFTLVNDIKYYVDTNRSILFGETEEETTYALGKQMNDVPMRDMLYMFKMLVMPDVMTNKPPLVKVSFGSWFVFRGNVTQYSIRVDKTYKDLTPKIVVVNLSLKGDYNVI